MSLMATAEGESVIEETVFERRMQHVGELQRMGAEIRLENSTAYISGVDELVATSLTGGDLRSSAAMVLASLIAKGTSVIQGLNHLDRGYENFETKLCALGASITRHKHNNKIELGKTQERPEVKKNFYSGSKVA